MANNKDDHNKSELSGVGNLTSNIRENRCLSKIRDTQVAIMTSVFEDLADTCLRLQPEASPQDFSALSLILQAKRYSVVSSEFSMSQTDAVESALSADFDKLGDVVMLTKQEVAKVTGITPYLRELDAFVWRSGLDYRAWK